MDISTNKQLGWRFKIDRSPVVKMFYQEDGQWTAKDYSADDGSDSVLTFCTDFYRERNIPYTNLPPDFKAGEVV